MLRIVASLLLCEVAAATAGTTYIAGPVSIQDEGSAITSCPSAMNFVGSGVVVTGTTYGATITIDGGGGTDHNLLSATHLDTTAAAVARGAIIVGVGATPLWTRVTVGGAGTYVGSDGTDTAFRTIPFSDLSGTVSSAQAPHTMLSAFHTDSTATAVIRGDIIVGIGATPKWERLAVGTSTQFLKGGTEPAWSAVAFSDLTGSVGAAQFSDTSHGSRTVANAHRVSDLAVAPDSSTTTIGGDITPSGVVLNVGHDGTNSLANTFNIGAHTHAGAGSGGQVAFSNLSGSLSAAQHGSLGSGASHTTAQPVTVADEGSNVTNTPHTRLNFVGAGVSVADGGSGTATVTVSGGAGVASRSVFGPWTKVNVPASGSDLTFDIPTSALLPAGQARIRMPFAGKVVGISASMSAARTAGTATFEVFKNNTALTGTPTCVINATDTQRAYGGSGTGTFNAGDDIDVRVDMAGTYAPTTSEAVVFVIIEWTS